MCQTFVSNGMETIQEKFSWCFFFQCQGDYKNTNTHIDKYNELNIVIINFLTLSQKASLECVILVNVLVTNILVT